MQSTASSARARPNATPSSSKQPPRSPALYESDSSPCGRFHHHHALNQQREVRKQDEVRLKRRAEIESECRQALPSSSTLDYSQIEGSVTKNIPKGKGKEKAKTTAPDPVGDKFHGTTGDLKEYQSAGRIAEDLKKDAARNHPLPQLESTKHPPNYTPGDESAPAVAYLQHDLELQQHESATLKVQIERQSAVAEGLTKACADAREERIAWIDSGDGQNACVWEKKYNALKNVLNEVMAEMEELQAKLEKAENKIKRLEGEIERLQESLKRESRKVQDKDDHIGLLGNMLKRRDDQIRDLKEENVLGRGTYFPTTSPGWAASSRTLPVATTPSDNGMMVVNQELEVNERRPSRVAIAERDTRGSRKPPALIRKRNSGPKQRSAQREMYRGVQFFAGTPVGEIK